MCEFCMVCAWYKTSIAPFLKLYRICGQKIKVKTVQHMKPKEEAVKTVDICCRTNTEMNVDCNPTHTYR